MEATKPSQSRNSGERDFSELGLLMAFNVAYLNGVMEGEHPEIRAKWEAVLEYLLKLHRAASSAHSEIERMGKAETDPRPVVVDTGIAERMLDMAAPRRTWLCHRHGEATQTACSGCDCLHGMPATPSAVVRSEVVAAHGEEEAVQRSMRAIRDFGERGLLVAACIASISAELRACYRLGAARSSIAPTADLQAALREATAIGIASLFAYCGAYESLSTHKRKQWDRLAELAKLADAMPSAIARSDEAIELLRKALPHVHGNGRRMRSQFQDENGEQLHAEAFTLLERIQTFLRALDSGKA